MADSRNLRDFDPETTPVLLAALPAVQAQVLGPAGEEGVREIVGKRFALFPQPERSDAVWAAWWGEYYDALANVPRGALESGMRAWVKDPSSEFMPKPGRLLELAEKSFNLLAWNLKQLERHLLPEPPSAPEPVRQIAQPEDPRTVEQMLVEFRQGIASNQMPAPSKFRFQAPIDEHGISPALRDAMAKRK